MFANRNSCSFLTLLCFVHLKAGFMDTACHPLNIDASIMRSVDSTTGNAVSGSSASLRTPELDRRFSFSYMAKGLCICRRSKDCPLGHPFCISEIDRVHLEKSNYHCAYGDYLCLGCFIQQPTRRDVSRGADRPPSARLARLNISNSTYLLLYQHCTHSLRLRI